MSLADGAWGDGGGLSIERVARRRHRADFLDLPALIHRDDRNWITPLRMVEAERLSSRKHPFFEHGEAAFWIAYRNGRPVGRISAQIDRLHLERYRDAMGHFGLIEAFDDPAVFAGLFAAAEAWLRDRCIEQVTGPFNLSINEESGLLVEGFEHPPAMMTDHARHYYGPRIEQAGYRKEKDLFAFDFDFNKPLSQRWLKLIAAMERYPSILLRVANGRKLMEEFRTAIDVFNDAWSDNWNFVPFMRREADALIKGLKPFVTPDYMWFAEQAGNPIAFIAAMPDLNRAARGLNGRLFPFGWLPFLWRVKVAGIRRARVILLGVRKAYQATPLAAVVAAGLIERIRRAHLGKLDGAEISWVLEDNVGLLHLIDYLGMRKYRTFRVYRHNLTQDAPARNCQ